MKNLKKMGFIIASLVMVVAFSVNGINKAKASSSGKCKHKSVRTVVDVEPTCTKKGKGHTVCRNCGVTVKEKISIPATGHNFVNYVCTICGAKDTAKKNELYTIDGYTYKVTDTRTNTRGEVACVEVLNKQVSRVTIPDRVDIKNVSYRVTSIAKNCFSHCPYLTSVKIGNNVREIEKESFSDLNNLKEVTIGKDVDKIGEAAFQYCTSLKEVVIPNKVRTIGKYAFTNCTSLTKVIVGSDVQKIEEGAFSYCTSLLDITFKDDKVSNIGVNAIKGISPAATIRVPGNRIQKYKDLFTYETGYLQTMTIVH